MSKEEKEMLEAFRQLSTSGRVEVMSHTNIVLKAEQGIKKELKNESTDKKSA